MVIRYCAAVFVYCGGSLLVIFISLFRPFHPKSALWFTKIFPALTVKALGVDLEIRGTHILFQNYPCVYIANHQHEMDLAVHGTVVRLPTVTIGKKEILYIPFFGLLFWLTGQILIDRHHHRNAMESMTFAAKIIKKRGVAAWLFPEGTRSGDKPMQAFKKGAFYLAVQAQLPIVPVVASTYAKSVDLNRWKPGKVILEVLNPIPTVGKTIDDVEELMKVSHSRMAEHIAKLDKELAS